MPSKRSRDNDLSIRTQSASRRGKQRKRPGPPRVGTAIRQPPASSPATRRPRAFLGPELAAGVSGNEEAPEFSLKLLLHDPKIRDLGLRLWRQFSGAGAMSERELNEAGITFGDLWKPGVTESVTTSSTAEEIARYRKTLEYRAKFLEALLEETLADIERVMHLQPAVSAAPLPLAPPANPEDLRDARQEDVGQGGKEA
jgi:hypothetical protein